MLKKLNAVANTLALTAIIMLVAMGIMLLLQPVTAHANGMRPLSLSWGEVHERLNHEPCVEREETAFRPKGNSVALLCRL